MSVDEAISRIFKIVTFLILILLILISSFSVNWHFSVEIITVVLFLCAYTIILTLPIKRFKLGLSGFEGELERLIKEKVTTAASPETVEEVEEELNEISQEVIEPDTVLLRLSIEIEKTLRSIAESKGLIRTKVGLGRLTWILQQKQIISDPWLIDALSFFRKYRNKLIHEGKTTDIEAGINIGREVLVKLKQIQKKRRVNVF
jgi:hypothetical protein